MNGLRRNDDEALDKAGIIKMPLVSIVILSWNGKVFLQQFLPFVLAATYSNKRVIVADNASTDDSIVFLQSHFPEVEILAHSSNEGFAKGYNTALKQVKSDYYVLLNNDVEVTPGWIEPVVALMESDATIACCQPKIRSYQNRQLFEHAGAGGGWIDSFGYPFARGRLFDDVEVDRGQYDDVQPCFWASGAAMFVRADLYHQLGGLDEYFFAHQEEIDFCWRLQLAGYKIYVQPASVVYHVGGGTLKTESNFKHYLNFRNNLVMLAKNLSPAAAVYTITPRLMLDGIAAWKGLFEGNPGLFGAVVKSHIHFIKWLVWEQQKSLIPVTRNGKVNGWYRGSIVWQYFIKKKKSFLEIHKNK